MTLFLTIWGIAFLSLSVAVTGLTVVYRYLGGDLGTGSWRREGAVAVSASLLQSALLYVSILLTGDAAGALVLLAAFLGGFVYLATHLGEMGRLDASVIIAVQFLAALVTVLLFFMAAR